MLDVKISPQEKDYLSKIVASWQQLPLAWRLAATVYAGIHTLEEIDPVVTVPIRDVTDCLALIHIYEDER